MINQKCCTFVLTANLACARTCMTINDRVLPKSRDLTTQLNTFKNS